MSSSGSRGRGGDDRAQGPHQDPRGDDRGDDRRATQRAQRRQGAEAGEDPPSGSVESPVAPGEAQAGDRAEESAHRGGPVDVSPQRGRGNTERP
jgi:hypothetical protein